MERERTGALGLGHGDISLPSRPLGSVEVWPDVSAQGFHRLGAALFLGNTKFIRRLGFQRSYQANNVSCFLCL